MNKSSRASNSTTDASSSSSSTMKRAHSSHDQLDSSNRQKYIRLNSDDNLNEIYENEAKLIKTILDSNNNNKSTTTDLNSILEMLKKYNKQPNRIDFVINKLLDNLTIQQEDDESEDVIMYTDNSTSSVDKKLFSELKIMFPQKSDNSITKILIKYSKNFDFNKVCNELLENDSSIEIVDTKAGSGAGNRDEIVYVGSSNNIPTTSDFDRITQIIPDCDPSFIEMQIKLYQTKPNRVDIIVSNLIEKRNYPRKNEQIKLKESINKLNNLLNMSMNFDDFLKIYPNPFDYFYDKSVKQSPQVKKSMSKTMSVTTDLVSTQPTTSTDKNNNSTNLNLNENYKEHCRTYLANKFSQLSKSTIEKVLNKNQFRFTPSFREIESALNSKNIKMNEAKVINNFTAVNYNAYNRKSKIYDRLIIFFY